MCCPAALARAGSAAAPPAPPRGGVRSTRARHTLLHVHLGVNCVPKLNFAASQTSWYAFFLAVPFHRRFQPVTRISVRPKRVGDHSSRVNVRGPVR